MESVPYFAFMSGLTKRQPMVVSSSFKEREKALSALLMTKGARDMLSTPPAMTRSASPDLIACDERLDGNGGEIVSANYGERSAVAAEGSSNGVANVSRFHRCP